MSYIQGTQVRLRADFLDRASGEPTDPAEVVLTVEGPDGTLTQFTLTAGDVQREDVGRFFYVLDTSALEAGTWEYEFESTGSEATVGRKAITIRSRLGVAP